MPSGGIWIDLKQFSPLILEHLDHLSNKDRIRVGDKLMDEYTKAISTFPLALLTREEIITVAHDRKEYELKLYGQKTQYIDAFAAHFYAMAFFIEMLYSDHLLQNWTEEKLKKKNSYMTRCLAKIDKGIVRWRKSIARQASISERELNSSVDN